MPERAWLSEVAVAPLQQSLRDLAQAYQNFYNSITGKRKGPKVTRLDSKKDNQHNPLDSHEMVLNSMNQEAKYI